jgi:hypothetical protein
MEQYYLVPKEELDLISRQLEVLSETNNCGLTNDKAKEILGFKLIDLSDEAILDKKNLQVRKSVKELDRTIHCSRYFRL